MADNIRLFGGFRNNDVVYITLPLYHTNGGIIGVGQMILGGSTLAIRRKFSASNFWKDCIKFDATVSRWRCSEQWQRYLTYNLVYMHVLTLLHIEDRHGYKVESSCHPYNSGHV